jgi:hypothetical protein
VTPPPPATTRELAAALSCPEDTAVMLAAAIGQAALYYEPSVTWHGTVITPAAGGFALGPALRGPACGNADRLGYCPAHPSCDAVAGEQPWAEECQRGHGWQHVTGGGSFTGFAGGTSYWTGLECGCTLMDESGDVAAAR